MDNQGTPSCRLCSRRLNFVVSLAVLLAVALLSWTPMFQAYQAEQTDSLQKRNKGAFNETDNARTPMSRIEQSPMRKQPTTTASADNTLNDFPRYTTSSIIKTSRSLFYHAPRILIFTGDDTPRFRAFALLHHDTMPRENPTGKRSELFLPLLVDALQSHFPNRFTTGSLPFQLLYTTADISYSKCTFGNCTPADTNTLEMAPWINAGSVFREILVPGLEQFPNDEYMACLWHWRRTATSCTSHQFFSNWTWSDLLPAVIWRGSALPFLQFWNWTQLGNTSQWTVKAATPGHPQGSTPRQHCVNLARQAERMRIFGTDPSRLWIDCRFSGMLLSSMSPEEMLHYRYQIDLGGAGGTTWSGTLDKLSFPGLLFHHETPAQDWFYPHLEPWVHYVPINTDLSDLKAKYDWAEAHPEDAMKIAHAGTAFAKNLVSRETLHAEHELYFVRSLGRYVRAYLPQTNETLEALFGLYQDAGFSRVQFSECNTTQCTTNVGGEKGLQIESLPLPLN